MSNPSTLGHKLPPVPSLSRTPPCIDSRNMGLNNPSVSTLTESLDTNTRLGWTSVETQGNQETNICGFGFLSDCWRGWKVVVFGSWLNGLLVLLPVSCILQVMVPQADIVIFILCILAMIPLVKLHDLATCELALRIGGSKTGLIKASLSNIIELVVAVSALRKCELRVVQSSCPPMIGSILSGLLLVLGMGLFAGGLRFSDQHFDLAATQVQASLLGVSVGVVLLPAAYHFSLSGQGPMIIEEQKKDILRMSHGVSVILLAIHISYMLFQLWSHTHLYRDIDNTNNKTSGSGPARSLSFSELRRSLRRNRKGEDTEKYAQDMYSCTSSSSSVHLEPPQRHPYLGASESSEIASVNSDMGGCAEFQLSRFSSISVASKSVKLVQPERGSSLKRDVSASTQRLDSISSTSSLIEGKDKDAGNVDHSNTEATSNTPSVNQDDIQTPLLSWPMIALLLITVTVLVAINADWLVNSMNGSISAVISKQWIGLILLPAVNSVAECVTAMNVSYQDQLPLSISVAVGSTIQTTLFVIPFTVTLAWALGKPLALLFDPFESVVLYISVQTMSYVVARGRSSWLEGFELICLYVIIAVAFWYYPISDISTTLAVCTTSP